LGWPVATRRSLPREGAGDAARRKQAHVPTGIAFQTKAAMALALLDEAKADGVRHACVTREAGYGDNPHFLNGLEERGGRHVVAANFSGTLGRGQDSAILRADAALAAYPLQVWPTLPWSEGTNGGLRATCLARRCGRVDGEGTRQIGWLIGQRPGRGQHGDGKYCWSDFPATTPLTVLVEYAQRRHWVEQYHEGAKTELGWDQYQGRRWDGSPRHALTVMLSDRFLVWLAGRERAQRKGRGRPRAAFSPSPGPPPPAAPGGPSPSERMAAPCGHP
jgi:SRSO17 transposase